MKNFFDFSHFKGDVFGGLTAGIVALPLALAFGEQSGMGAAFGLYGAAFLAFIAAVFGGTPTQISGPTAPMTALSMLVVAAIVQSFEGNLQAALPTILMVFMLAGIFQIGLAAFRAGTFIKYIPYTVVSGFMSGIGVIILITQILPTLGYYPANDKELTEKFKPLAEEVILEKILKEEAQDGILVLEDYTETVRRAEQVTEKEIAEQAEGLVRDDARGVYGSLRYAWRALQNISWIELALAMTTLVVIYGFKRITTAVPSTLVALIAVTAGAVLLDLEYAKINEIPMGFPAFYGDDFIREFNPAALVPFIGSALMLAFLGAIDSLLTSVVADNLTKTRHEPNRELLGQGIGNSISALFGGLPGAGATIRTVVNIQAGGKTKLSGMIAGILLFVIMLALGNIASMIPAAVLAGILITVGIGVMDYKGLRALRNMDNTDKIILLLVLVLTVFWQLIGAVAIGLIVAALVFMKRMGDVSEDQSTVGSLAESEDYEDIWEHEEGIPEDIKHRVFFKEVKGPLFFGFVAGFKEMADGLEKSDILVIRVENVPFVDQSGLYALEEVIDDLYEQDVLVALSGVQDQPLEMLQKMNIVPDSIPREYVFRDFESCEAWLKKTLMEEGALDTELEKVHRLLEKKR